MRVTKDTTMIKSLYLRFISFWPVTHGGYNSLNSKDRPSSRKASRQNDGIIKIMVDYIPEGSNITLHTQIEELRDFSTEYLLTWIEQIIETVLTANWNE